MFSGGIVIRSLIGWRVWMVGMDGVFGLGFCGEVGGFVLY